MFPSTVSFNTEFITLTKQNHFYFPKKTVGEEFLSYQFPTKRRKKEEGNWKKRTCNYEKINLDQSWVNPVALQVCVSEQERG